VDPLAEKYPSLSPYTYAANNPVVVYDKDGRILDIILDIAFIAYDIYDIASTTLSGKKVSSTQWAALGADVIGAAVPFASGGGAAVRATAKAKRAIQVRRNYAKGKAAEAVAETQLKEAGFEILGRQVTVKTSQGARRYDFVAQQGDEIVSVEVKSGKGKRTKAQKAKDKEVAEKGGKYVGKRAAEAGLEGRTAKTRTIEWRVKEEDLKK